MPITANVLYRDSFNFFRNQLANIISLALLSAGVSVLLNQIFGTDAEIFKILNAVKGGFSTSASTDIQTFIHQMTPEQQLILLKATAAATFSALVGNTLLISWVLTLLCLVSQKGRGSALHAIGSSAPAFPRLMLLLFICSVIIQLGLRMLVVPGIIMAIAFSLASIITTTDKKGVFASIRLSSRLAYSHAWVIAPAIVLWLLSKLILFCVFSYLQLLAPYAANLSVTALNNLISSFFLIYLFRLYSLLRS